MGEEALVPQRDYQPYCHQPRVMRRETAGERLVVQRVSRRSRLEPCWEEDEGRKPSCLAGVWEALVACQAEACLDDDMDNHVEEGIAGIHLTAVGSTVAAEHD
jgi:hypothetical protein